MTPQRTFVRAIWAFTVGAVSLALLSQPVTGQDDANALQAELTMLRSAVKSQADQIAHLKAENAKLAGQVRRLEDLCAKAGITTPGTAPPPATRPATTSAPAKPVMTLADVARVVRVATAKDKTALQRHAALAEIKGWDIRGTMIVKDVEAVKQGGLVWVLGSTQDIPSLAVQVPEAEGLKLSPGKSATFTGKIKGVEAERADSSYFHLMVEDARIWP
jgi:hypothetical protein